MDDRRILLTGATGYVGGRLLPELESRERPVRCLVRHAERLVARAAPGTEIVEADLLEPGTLPAALDGVHTAVYLVHLMAAGESFEALDRRAAHAFAAAAREAGVRRIVYVGGLGHGEDLSPHLRSRQEVGRILRDSGVPTIELRASIVIGSGSLSFEMIRALVEKLPVMITPRWVERQAQPIAVEDLVDYLIEAIEGCGSESAVFEIGGPDRVSYGDLMREYARRRGLARRMIPVPALSPRLSSLWLGLVTPVYARVGRHLLDGVRNDTVVRDATARERFAVEPMGVSEAIARALAHEDRRFARTRWSDALSSAGARRPPPADPAPRIVDTRVTEVPVPPRRAFAPIRRIGGATGWYFGDPLWRLRGFLDLLAGGVGTRRGRPDPERPAVGDTLDFWRVERYRPDRLLRLRAEMKLPGRAWLQFEVTPTTDGSRVRQTAIFDPKGLTGRAYWWGLWPVHALVFRGMLAGVARRAVEGGADAPSADQGA